AVDVVALVLGLDGEATVEAVESFFFQFVVGESGDDVADGAGVECCFHYRSSFQACSSSGVTTRGVRISLYVRDSIAPSEVRARWATSLATSSLSWAPPSPKPFIS